MYTSSISERLSQRHLDVIECGLFNSWPQQGPNYNGYLTFGNVVCDKFFNGVVEVRKIDEGIELTHRLEGFYRGLYARYEDDKIDTGPFNVYRISDSNPEAFRVFNGDIEVPHPLRLEGLELALDYSAKQLCGKLALRIDEFLAT